MITSSQKPQILGKFLGYFKEISRIFLKINKIRTKIFNFSIFKDDGDIIFKAAHKRVGKIVDGFWDLVTKDPYHQLRVFSEV